VDLRVEGSNPSSHPRPAQSCISRYSGGVRVSGLRLYAKGILILVLMLLVVMAVMSGIDLINGRWDEMPIRHPI
jgi:hypothetical protein